MHFKTIQSSKRATEKRAAKERQIIANPVIALGPMTMDPPTKKEKKIAQIGTVERMT